MRPLAARKHLAALVVVAAVLVGMGVFFPHLIELTVGGAVAGAAALVSARRRRHLSNTTHADSIEAETNQVEDLQQEAEAAVAEAEERAEEDPQEGAEGLSETERRARLEQAARRLK
jgi:flagellar biosynthesis component FlhA